MPNLNGLQLYHRLKAIDKDIKIFFLSALEASKEIASIYPDFLGTRTVESGLRGVDRLVVTLETIILKT
jgi:hypothetical protein